MSISIDDYQLPFDTHNLYNVNFYHHRIHTLVTHTPSFVDSWISQIESIHHRRLHSLIVGLDVEWRPNRFRNQQNPVATLQLCVGRRCLIFQLLYSPYIPLSLFNFLSNPSYTFVGVGIDKDVEKLTHDYGLSVANTVDLRLLAAEGYGVWDLRNAGLTVLARQVLGLEVVKPRRVTMSCWDTDYLYPAQETLLCFTEGSELVCCPSTSKKLLQEEKNGRAAKGNKTLSDDEK